jgi:5,5'-dehydrodivanillate O-demethylase
MSEDFTLYRGEAGVSHLLTFRCAHRGTQLSTGWVEGDELRCFYHGWKYGPDGQCTEQPAEPEPFCQRIRIRSYPTHEYLGLVFAYLGEGETPPLPRYPDFEEDGILEVQSLYRACNYFNTIENEVDSVHVSFAHRKSRPGVANQPPPLVDGEETEWGIRQRYTYATEAGEVVKVSYLGMPNIKYGQMPPQTALETGPGDNIRWMVPIDDFRHVYFVAHLAHVTGENVGSFRERQAATRGHLNPYTADLAEKLLAGHGRIQDVTEEEYGVPIIQTQDDVAQTGQGAIANRDDEHLGRSDNLVVLLRRIWTRELDALAEGRPLKRWVRPQTLRAHRPVISDGDPRILAGTTS